MAGKKLIYTELTEHEIAAIVRNETKQAITPLQHEVETLRAALKADRPAFDRSDAAWYCNKSTKWIDDRRSEDNLPSHMVGRTPHFKRSHLDHILNGGTFDKKGNPILKSTKTG